jgi:serine/threonine protein kinase
LKPGQRRQEFTVERTLGVGAYSIVYLAHDTRLDRRVAIKDYLPAMLAQRMPAGDVAPSLPRFEALFDKGLVGFLNEARLLGSFDHPGLVKVYRYWAEAGTAYMAMPFYEGVTLRRSLAERGAPPEEAWLRQLAAQLMQALQVLHRRARCVFRRLFGRHRRRPGGAPRAAPAKHGRADGFD